MSISAVPVAVASIAESRSAAPIGKKPPRPRLAVAKPDASMAPEAR